MAESGSVDCASAICRLQNCKEGQKVTLELHKPPILLSQPLQPQPYWTLQPVNMCTILLHLLLPRLIVLGLCIFHWLALLPSWQDDLALFFTAYVAHELFLSGTRTKASSPS